MIEKIKSLSKDTIIYGTSTIIGRFLNFFLVPLYTNIFLPEAFGVVANIYAYIAILNVFFTVGLESGFFKFYSTLEVGDDKENFSHPFIGIFSNSFVLCIVFILFSKFFTGVFLVNEKYEELIKITGLILFFDALVTVPFAYLRMKRETYRFASLKVLNIIVNVVANIVFILVLKLGIESIFYSNFLASIITFLFLFPTIWKNLKISFNRRLWSELLRFSVPYIPSGISSNIIQVVNRPILNILRGDHDVGVFQANYRLGIFMMLFVSMFEFAWRPFFLQNAKEKDAKELYSKILTVFLIVGSVILVFLTLFIENIAQIRLPFKGYLIGKSYWGGLEIVPVILFSYLIYGIYINLMAGIYIEKKTKYLPYITGISAIVNVIANFILIPIWGLMGSAYATLLSYIFMAVGIYIISQKYYKIEYEFSKIILILSLSICSYILMLISNWYFNGSIPVKLAIFILFIVTLFVFGILKKSYLKIIKK
jgi:O-antigen/teichoic acid export membrane protein